MTLSKNFKSKTQTVDSVGEVGVLLIEKKYNKFGGLNSYA
jgi:hypothetical protein